MTANQLQTPIFTQPVIFSISYKGPFKPNGQYFFCNFAALRKGEAIEIRLLIFWCIHQHIYIPAFVENIHIQSG